MKLFTYVERKQGDKTVINEICKCDHLITEHHDLVPNLPDEAKGCGQCEFHEACLCTRFTFKGFVYKENKIKILGYATLIKTDGQISLIERYTPFKLETLQKLVNGYIEIVPTKDGKLMVLNEEGKLKNLPINMTATNMVELDVIVGDVVVCDKFLLR